MIAFLALFFAAAPSHRLAVLDVKLGAGVEPSLGPYLTQLLAADVAANSGDTPLTSSDIAAILGFEQQKQLVGCDGGNACIAELAGALGVERVVYASVTAAAGHYLVSVVLLDAKHALPLGRGTQTPLHVDDALADALAAATAQAFGNNAPPPAPIAPSRPFLTRRTWGWIAAGTGVALGGVGAFKGTNAYAAARAGDAQGARSKAYVADGFFAGAILCGAGATILWMGSESK